MLSAHLQPRPNVIAQRYKFFKRDRLPNESVPEYLAELNSLSEFCEFGDKLDDYIRDRLVCGIGNERILQKLLSVRDLTLKQATDHAVAMEAACRDSRDIQSSRVGLSAPQAGGFERSPEAALHKIGEGGKGSCFRCGNPRHLADACPFKTKECFGCKKVGHVKRMCRQGQAGKGDPKKKCNQVEVETEEGEEVPIDSLETWSLYKCALAVQDGPGVSVAGEGAAGACPLKAQGAGRGDPVVVTVLMNGHSVSMELDTGAAVTVMSLSAYERVKRAGEILDKTSLRLRTYTGELVRPAGVGRVDVVYEGQSFELPVTVVKGNVPTLLGRDWWLSTLKLNWPELFPAAAAVHRVAASSVSELLSEFPEVFTDKLGA